MYRVRQNEIPELKVDISFGKVLVIAITIFATLIIPIQVVSQAKKYEQQINASSKQTNASEARVAGASTSSAEENKLLGIFNIDPSSQAGQYLLIGMFFIGISLMLLIFLLADSRSYKSANAQQVPNKVYNQEFDQITGMIY